METTTSAATSPRSLRIDLQDTGPRNQVPRPKDSYNLLQVTDNDQKYSGDNFRGAEHASPYPVSRLGAPMSLVDMAKAIESASAKVAMRTNAQLEVIVEQMKALQERAREIVEQASRDVDLIHAECRFTRVPGRVYHLYERADGHRYFSMVGPDEYGRG